MEVTAHDIANIPRENLRVPREEFVAVWTAAERLSAERAQQGVSDWYTAGVVTTCRWLAHATIRPETGPGHLALSPATTSSSRAMPETIEREVLAADKLAFGKPQPAWLHARPGWAAGIAATFSWAWLRGGRSPLELRRRADA